MKADPEGYYLFLKGSLQGTECTLANVYCPNKNPKGYLRGLGKLMDFKKGKLITPLPTGGCLEGSTSESEGLLFAFPCA